MKGKALGRRRLADVAGIVTPDTILRWYRRLVATKYDGSTKRRTIRRFTEEGRQKLSLAAKERWAAAKRKGMTTLAS